MGKRTNLDDWKRRKKWQSEQKRRRRILQTIRFGMRTLQEQELWESGVEHARRTSRGTLLHLVPPPSEIPDDF